MKCVRCGADTRRKSSFCKNCEDFLNNKEVLEEELPDSDEDSQSINWGYIMVTISVIAVAIMVAFIVYCNNAR